MSDFTLAWKPDWAAARENYCQWWRQEGLVLWITAPKDKPWLNLPQPLPSASLRDYWIDPHLRQRRNEYDMSRTYYGADAFPIFNTSVGAGDLAAILGARWQFAETTVWFESRIADPDQCPALIFDRSNHAFQALRDLLDAGMRHAEGRYMVGMPDLVENLDILAALRGPQNVLLDLYDRPDWVKARLGNINQVWREVFDLFYHQIRNADGSSVFSAFNLWGPGKTAKVQCDASAMLSPDMFTTFIAPALNDQCSRLDCVLYHLDGEDCLGHLDALLDIKPIQAIEWTPRRCSLGEGGGCPQWYDLYRRILRAGKSVQAIWVKYDEVIPLLDAVGPKGMYIVTSAESEDQARCLEERVRSYRP